MSITAKIDGIPLFDSKWKAEQWGRKFGLSGTHTHIWQESQVCWMAGESHQQAIEASKPRNKTNGSIINNTNTQNINQNYSQQLLQTRVAVNRESSEPGSEYDGG